MEIFLRYSRYFVKGDFVIGGVACMHFISLRSLCYIFIYDKDVCNI